MPYENLMTLPDWVAELTTEHDHREPFTVRRGGTVYTSRHVTHVPSLLEQLRKAGRPSTGENSPGAYSSRPAAHIEAMDTLLIIDREASRWVRVLGAQDPDTTEQCILRLHGLHAGLTACRSKRTSKHGCCDAHRIEADIKRWWTQARIVTGWDSAAWRPDNTCPMCGKRGTLRVRFSAASALCIDCRETWDRETLGLLAQHINLENDARKLPGVSVS